MWVNTSRLLSYDATNPLALSKMQAEGLTQAHEIAAFAKQYLPGFKNAYLSRVAPQVGVRETRRILGDYLLTEMDIASATDFKDSVARGCFGMEMHNPSGSGISFTEIPEGKSYTIPARSLFVRKKKNLIMGCRAISCTHEAHSAIRVQPNVMAIGQAAGTAAALSVSFGSELRKLPVAKLQSVLKEAAAVI
jgi:hypothetical protein